MKETEWILELTLTELHELQDILQYDNLLIQPTENMQKFYTANTIKHKVNTLIEVIESEEPLPYSE